MEIQRDKKDIETRSEAFEFQAIRYAASCATIESTDEQTLSAVAWLNSNKVDISCYKIVPYKLNENVFIDIKKILPVMEYSDFYVDIATQKSVSKDKKRDITRGVYPKIDAMLEWGGSKSW